MQRRMLALMQRLEGLHLALSIENEHGTFQYNTSPSCNTHSHLHCPQWYCLKFFFCPSISPSLSHLIHNMSDTQVHHEVCTEAKLTYSIVAAPVQQSSSFIPNTYQSIQSCDESLTYRLTLQSCSIPPSTTLLIKSCLSTSSFLLDQNLTILKPSVRYYKLLYYFIS